MATNDFKPFATGSGANVLSQADYDALSARTTGFLSGKASSAQVNKALRQASTIAAVVAQFISDNSGDDTLDNGNLPTLLASLENAFSSLPLGGYRISLALPQMGPTPHRQEPNM
ncbi:hypothetical protein [Klebsiella variicola]|uniref:hypothetical protein n=1 Tax=Klebsiella variicola TaxID=244366 RepID=UPI001F11A752|nr:hypothetical protein [Klebsiella variicola]